ncbi:MAG: archaeal proteasome endopeptidase complex subunit alpha [Aigarchaeota archaeon]|nr:archaeal proteasome endopeptidase complex subunit alpha [Aigarchaeota archaeon]MDW8092423.1 archaeal proteasome endopeptidase complex subunit alpha [Nitrososphaerota archaeon]
MALGMASAYDRAITVFSPQGRLFQVEYALETVKSGSSALALRVKEGVVMAVEERTQSKLQSQHYSQKLFQIDEHIGAAASGLISDARILVDSARVYAQILRLSYDESPSVEMIAKRIADVMQLYTQHAGVRPFGAALLIGGVSGDGGRVFYTEPSGVMIEYDAWGIGRGSDKIKEFFEMNYKFDLTLEEAKTLALKSLVYSIDRVEENWSARLVVIPVDTRQFMTVSQEEVNSILRPLLSAKK